MQKFHITLYYRNSSEIYAELTIATPKGVDDKDSERILTEILSSLFQVKSLGLEWEHTFA